MQVIRIADIVGVDSAIRNASYENTLFVGPAVLAPVGGVTLTDCSFTGDPAEPEALFIEVPEGTKVMGVVALVDVTFRRCRFENASLIGTAANIKKWRSNFTLGPPLALRPSEFPAQRGSEETHPPTPRVP